MVWGDACSRVNGIECGAGAVIGLCVTCALRTISVRLVRGAYPTLPHSGGRAVRQGIIPHVRTGRVKSCVLLGQALQRDVMDVAPLPSKPFPCCVAMWKIQW